MNRAPCLSGDPTITSDEAEQKVDALLAEFADGTERQLEQIQAVDEKGFRDGYEKAVEEMVEKTERSEIASLPRNSALHRAGATVMRRNGFTEAEVVEHYRYSPDSIE